MATERSRQLVLGALVLALIVVIAKMWPGTSANPAPSSNRTAGAGAGGKQTGSPAVATPPAVHLDVLNAERPRPEGAERNLFRFKERAAPASAAPPAPIQRAQPMEPAAPTGPPPPPSIPPITLKFIGIVEAPSHGEKIAILSDGRNAPFYGKEGAIIEGRYRILKIGVESVEIAYADGRGRQTIRLTGS
jgi:hypothetical protein